MHNANYKKCDNLLEPLVHGKQQVIYPIILELTLALFGEYNKTKSLIAHIQYIEHKKKHDLMYLGYTYYRKLLKKPYLA